jgi:hypothetical protein
MYRTLSNSLMKAGWALITSEEFGPQAWTRFTTVTDATQARYNAIYQTTVILLDEPRTDGHNSES